MFRPNGNGTRALSLALLIAMGATSGAAMTRDYNGSRQMVARIVEPQRDPRSYRPFERPPEAASRPQSADAGDYNHNFQARRQFGIGAYHPPRRFRYQRYGYGDILPGIFWGAPYYLSDFWLFGLDVPPIGYEWVRYGPDALLINLQTGQVMESVYGIFL